MYPTESQYNEEMEQSEICGHEFHEMSKNATRNIMFPELNDEIAMDYIQELM